MTRPAADPTGRIADLRAALADPRLATLTVGRPASEDATAAAYRVAVALGYCRLFGLNAGDLDGTLPVAVVEAAADYICRQMPDWVTTAAHLGDEWDAALDPHVADRLVDDRLAERTDLWAAQTAVWEAEEALREDADPDAPVVAVAVARMPSMGELDFQLQRHKDILGTQANSTRVNNWRAMLADPHRDPLPWWLDPLYYGVTLPSELVNRSSPIPIADTEYASAAATPTGTGGLGTTLTWQSPDEKYVAELVIPARLTAADDVGERDVNFTRTADDFPAAELTGQQARFGTSPDTFTVIDGKVRVTLGWLRAVGPLDVLLVGHERWLLRESVG